MNVAVIYAQADKEDGTWLCRTPTKGPVGDLFAVGDTFREARSNLAEIVIEFIKGQIDPDIEAVSIMCLTRKTFKVAATAGGSQ